MMELIIVGANKLGQHIAKNYSQFGLPYNILGFVDDTIELQGKTLGDYPVLGPIFDILSTKKVAVVFAFDSIPENSEIIKKLSLYPNLEFPNLVSSGSWISRDCIIGKGNVVLQGSLINFGTLVGNFNFFGEHCAIWHESIIGNYCMLDKDITIGGYVILGEGTRLLEGSEVSQGVRIGQFALVEKWSKITEDIQPFLPVNKRSI